MTEKICGIYCICNVIDGKCYVGRSVNVRSRYAYHKSLLRRGKHDNLRFQAAWDDHGESNFTFEVLRVCDKQELDSLERQYIQSYGEGCYNLESGGIKGKKLDETTKRKIGVGNAGKKRSTEARRKVSENHADFLGSKHPKAKLTEINVIEIKKRLAVGEKTKQIARDYGVASSTVMSIKTGANWSHIKLEEDTI